MSRNDTIGTNRALLGFMRARLLTALLSLMLAVVIAACGDKTTPTNPSPTQLDVTGRWAGDLTVQGIAGRMTWTLTQVNGGVTGPVLVSLPSGTVLLNGFLTGTLTGPSLAYTISVGPGGIPNQPTCGGQLGGSMNVTVTNMAGSIMVMSSSCTIQFSSNNLALTKQ